MASLEEVMGRASARWAQLVESVARLKADALRCREIPYPFDTRTGAISVVPIRERERTIAALEQTYLTTPFLRLTEIYQVALAAARAIATSSDAGMARRALQRALEFEDAVKRVSEHDLYQIETLLERVAQVEMQKLNAFEKEARLPLTERAWGFGQPPAYA